MRVAAMIFLGLVLSGMDAAAATPAGPGIRLCSVGYLPDVPKIATVVGAEPGGEFLVVDTATSRVALRGELGPLVDSPPTKERVRLADFSALQGEGTYVLRVPGLPDSPRFAVSAQALNRSLVGVMLGFYGQRCGQAVRFAWDGQTFAHGVCHEADVGLDYLDPAKAGQRCASRGGWHDAGDYGKYTLNAAFTTGMMLLAWERNTAALAALSLPAIPEHGGTLPDYLAELKFNLDWLLTVQLGNGEAVHKVTTLHFGPMAQLPEAERAPQYFTPPSRHATLAFAAVGAMAARVYAAYDPVYAGVWREASRRAWIAARTMTDADPDTSAFKTGPYFAPSASGYLWALIEVRLAFGEDFLTDAERLAYRAAVESDERLFLVSWDWARAQNLGLYSWLFSEEARREPAALAKRRKDLLAGADELVAASERHAYGRGLEAYQWGGNGVVARSAMTLQAAYLISGDQRYRDAAFAQIAHLYGRNPFGRSFVTGDGERPPLFPHHRPSAGDDVAAPWPGHLVGGPNPGPLEWFDETTNYRTNENAINWDAALAYALAGFYSPEPKP